MAYTINPSYDKKQYDDGYQMGKSIGDAVAKESKTSAETSFETAVSATLEKSYSYQAGFEAGLKVSSFKEYSMGFYRGKEAGYLLNHDDKTGVPKPIDIKSIESTVFDVAGKSLDYQRGYRAGIQSYKKLPSDGKVKFSGSR